MLDAWGKPESGIKEGNLRWGGRYYECLNSQSQHFKPKYCTTYIGGSSNPVSSASLLFINVLFFQSYPNENLSILTLVLGVLIYFDFLCCYEVLQNMRYHFKLLWYFSRELRLMEKYALSILWRRAIVGQITCLKKLFLYCIVSINIVRHINAEKALKHVENSKGYW